jgi:hypothetical protein
VRAQVGNRVRGEENREDEEDRRGDEEDRRRGDDTVKTTWSTEERARDTD